MSIPPTNPAGQVRILGLAADRAESSRVFPLKVFGKTLTLGVKGTPSGLLGTQASTQEDLEQLALGLESLVVGAVTHDPKIRNALDKIREAYPKSPEDELLAHLFTYLTFRPDSVELREPLDLLPGKISWEKSDLQANSESNLRLFDPQVPVMPGPRDAIQLAYQALFKKYREEDQNPRQCSPNRALSLWWHLERYYPKWKLPKADSPPTMADTLKALFGEISEPHGKGEHTTELSFGREAQQASLSFASENDGL
jgi:hypothetical protein